MRFLVSAVFGAGLAACVSSPGTPAPTVTPADLRVLEGGGWSGTLTYRDYSPPFGDVTLEVIADARLRPEGLVVALAYPSEPSANGESTLELSPDGRAFGGETITERSEHDGRLRVVTAASCLDDDRPATCTHRYEFGPELYVAEKTVDFGDGEGPIVRNVFRLRRSSR